MELKEDLTEKKVEIITRPLMGIGERKFQGIVDSHIRGLDGRKGIEIRELVRKRCFKRD